MTGTGGTTATGGAPCIKRWTVQKIGTAATSSVTVGGGAMVLRSSNSRRGDLLNVTQSALVGDFDATFTFEAFVLGGAGAFVQAAVAEAVAAPTTPIVTAGIGEIPATAGNVPGLSATFQPGTSALQGTTEVAGTFRFQRAGSSLTVTATPTGGGPRATTTNASYGTFDVQIGLQIGSNLSTVIASETSIRITSFSLSGGAPPAGGPAVMSDDFACDSLK